MTLEIQVLVGCPDVYAAEESAAGVPSGVVRFAGVGHHGYHIVLSPSQLVGNVNLKPHIAIVGSANVLTVQIDIAYVHDTSEIQQYALIFRGFIGN